MKGLLTPMHIVVIVIVILVVFGPDKLPELVRLIAKAIRDLKKAMEEPAEEIKKMMNDIDHDTKNVNHKQ